MIALLNIIAMHKRLRGRITHIIPQVLTTSILWIGRTRTSLEQSKKQLI